MERMRGEKVVAVIGAGGCMKGIYPYTSDVLAKFKSIYPCIDEVGDGDVLCDNRLGRQRFYDGDISVVEEVRPTYGVLSRHVYEMAGRNARKLDHRIEERLKAGGKDELVEAIEQDEISDFTLIICVATVSGAGYVICRRLAKKVRPKKEFGGIIRLLNIPSILEPGVEDTLNYFLEEEGYPDHVKTLLMSTDVAYLVYKNLIVGPNLKTTMNLRIVAGDPQSLLGYVKGISFDGVDYIMSQVYGILFGGGLVKDLRLAHEGNVKRLDSADMFNFIGQGSHYVVSAFSVDVLNVHPDLDDVVALGATVPLASGEHKSFLEEYAVILPESIAPRLRKIRLSHQRGRVKGLALSKVLDDYGIGIAFVRIDWNRFRNMFREFIGVV